MLHIAETHYEALAQSARLYTNTNRMRTWYLKSPDQPHIVLLLLKSRLPKAVWPWRAESAGRGIIATMVLPKVSLSVRVGLKTRTDNVTDKTAAN